MPLKQNWSVVKKELQYCSEKDLLGIIQEMYQLNKTNKEYLHLKLLAGNNTEQKQHLIKDSIGTIQKKWNTAYHDPYGYSGETVKVKITPMKEPLIAYKKAIGVDYGYFLLLAEYICCGYKFLKNNCAEPSDTATNSINVMAKDLFELLLRDQSYINVLDKKHVSSLKDFMDDYEASDEAILAYKKIKDLF